MTAAEAFQTHDLNDLMDRLTAYAYGRLKTVDVKDFEGKQPYDVVAELMEKVLTGIRDFEGASCSFPEFLFGCLKSDIDAFFKKKKFINDKALPEIHVQDSESILQEKQQYIAMLQAEGANDDEILIFEAWCEGTTRPAEIAEILEINVNEIYNIKKRLARRLQKVRTQLSHTA